MYRSNKPFPIKKERVEISPFKTRSKLQQILEKYRKNEKVGFTYESSLKSMGLIPRNHGHYELGMKYQ